VTGLALEVRDLRVLVGGTPAVNGVSFTLPRGRRTGLIGESGSGKTLTGLAIMGLLPEGLSASGSAWYGGEDLLALPESRLCALRGDRLAMVFQEPMTALNPLMRIGDQVAEPLVVHRRLARARAGREAVRLLERVQVPDAAEKARQYPHQLSGGQRQRAMIAMAMATSPDLLIADEPTTALDVTVQAQVLALIGRLVDEEGATLLLITHDLPVVDQVCDRVLVMYGGRLVEAGDTAVVFGSPRHPYTLGLMEAIPPLDEDIADRHLHAIPGVVPELGRFPSGCPFRTRCARADDACAVMPALEGGPDGHLAACWHPVG
jgi:peptide/nickel transport system ATP-binding protein